MIPTTAAEWAAITPNDADRKTTDAWGDVKACGSDIMAWFRQLAAASRIAEHERCVERLAAYLFDCEWHTHQPVNGGKAACVAESRRILEDR